MNRTVDQTARNRSAKRGTLARKLLQAAKRRTRAGSPTLSLLPDEESLPSESAKVLGPYGNGTKWRLVIKEGQGRKSVVFSTEQEALAVRQRLLANIEERGVRTIGEAVHEYLDYKRKRGCSERSLRTVREKLLPFLPYEKAITAITPKMADSLYTAQSEKFAAATHHKNLRDAKAFYRYCIKQKYATTNPFAEVQAIGKANAGKPQLRQDEARKLSDYLISRASIGDTRALALLVQVVLGLRSGEVLKLRKRDLDCRATIVVVDGTKNRNAKRSLELDAPIVRDLLLRRCETLAPDAFIFTREGSTQPFATPTLWKGLACYCKRLGLPIVCPHSLRGLHSSLAVKAGATSAFVAQALGHGSDAVTRKHYIAPSAIDSARTSRVAGALLGEADLDSLIATLRSLPSMQLDRVCAAVGIAR